MAALADSLKAICGIAILSAKRSNIQRSWASHGMRSRLRSDERYVNSWVTCATAMSGCVSWL